MSLTKRGKRRLAILVAVLTLITLAVGITIVLADARRAQLAEVARREGLAAYAEGDYEAALRKLGPVAAQDHSDLEVLLALAGSRSRVIEVNRRHLVSATALYKRILQIQPDNEKARRALLDLYGRLGYRAELGDIADQILETSPDHSGALSAKARIAYSDRRFEEALSLAKRLSELDPQNLSWRELYLGCSRMLDEDGETLVKTVDQWIEAHEQDGRFRLLKSRLLADLGDIRGARETARAAVKLGAASPDVLESMLDQLDSLALSEEASTLLQTATKQFPDQAWIFEAAARRHWRSGRADEVIAELDRAARALGGLTRPLRRWQVLAHASRGERAEAIEALDLLLEADDAGIDDEADRLWAEAIRAGLNPAERGWSDVLAAYERAAAAHPRDMALHYLRAQAYREIGEHDLAIRVLENIVRLDPVWHEARLALADALLDVGRPQRAFELAAAVLRRNPEAALRTYRLFVRAWVQAGAPVDPPGAPVRSDLLDLLAALNDELGWDAEMTPLLAEALQQRNLIADARALIDRALEADDVDAATLRALAEVSGRAGLGREAELLARARERAGLTPDLVAAQARLLARQGQVEDALELIESAVTGAAEPQRTGHRLRPLRIELMLSADSDAALAEMERWLLKEPTRSAAAFILSQEEASGRQDLIKRAIDVLETQLGERSSQVRLARATYWHRFHQDDGALRSKATQTVAEVLARTPDSRRALTLMAELLLSGPDPQYAEAIDRLRRAVDLYPHEGALYPRLIALLQRQGDFDSAEFYLSRLSPLADADPDLRAAELGLLRRQGDFERAIARLSSWIDAESPESEQLELALLYVTTGRHAQAGVIFDRLVRSREYSEAVAVAAADYFAATGRFEHGLKALADLAGGDAGAMQVALARLHQHYGSADDAARHLAQAAERDPARPDLWARISDLHLVRGEFQEAKRAALRGLELAPAEPDLHSSFVAASMSLDGAERRAAIATLESINSLTPALLQTVRLYDRLLGRGESNAPAPADLRDARQLVSDFPNFLPAWRLAITIHVRAGQRDEAIRLARRAVGRLPTAAEPAETACALLAEADRPNDALQMARLWRQRSLADPLPAEVATASLLLDLERPAEAARRIAGYGDRLLRERHEFPDRLEVWLGAMVDGNRLDEIAVDLAELLRNSRQWRHRALELVPRFGPEGAAALLEMIESLGALRPQEQVELASAWASLGRRFEAVEHYHRADALLAAVPENAANAGRVVLLRADLAMRRGDLTLAENLYRTLLDLGDNDVAALNNLATVLVKQGARCDEASALARRAAALSNGHPSVLDTLAQALLCQGQLAEGERVVRQALAEQPGKAAFLTTLASALHSQGRTAEARNAIEEARAALRSARWPDPGLLRRVEALAEELNAS